MSAHQSSKLVLSNTGITRNWAIADSTETGWTAAAEFNEQRTINFEAQR